MSELAELIRKAMDARLAEVRVAIPVRIERYDLATQTVDVQPLVKDHQVLDDGHLVESLPQLKSVPVAFPRGGGFFISLPLAKGDTGRVVVCDRSIDQWRKLGGEVDPLDIRMHAFSGAVFEPDLADSKHALKDAHAQNMVFGKDDGGAQIHLLPSGEVHVGKLNAAQFAAQAQKVLDQLTAIVNSINTFFSSGYNVHLHPTATGPSGAPIVPASPLAAPQPVAATKVKVE